MEMIERGGQERVAQQQAAQAGCSGNEEAGAAQRVVAERLPRLGPAHTMGDVLQDQRDGGDQAGDETAARQVVSAQEDECGNQQRHR